MGASDARKVKRRQKFGTDPRRVEEANDQQNKKQRTGRGRSDYRNITRTARRGPKDEDQEEHSEDLGDDGSDSEQELGSDVEAISDDKSKAYNALLGLLTVEQADEEDDEDEEGEKNPEEDDDSEQESEEEEGHIAGLREGEVSEEEDQEEEEPEEADNISDVDSDDEDNRSDPFDYHFANTDEAFTSKAIKSLEDGKWKNTKRSFDSHTAIVSHPPVGSNYTLPTSPSLNNYHFKKKVLDTFVEKCKGDEFVETNSTARKLLDPLFSYNDILFPYNINTEVPNYRRLYALHALNHVYRTTDKILKNNHRLHLQSERILAGKLDPQEEKEYKDQGFTRPKVLIMLPTRNHCYKVVQDFIKVSGVEQVENQKKFKNEFYEESVVPENKPDDFKELFEGNTNDFFCIGAKMNRKSMKLYTSFYNSDILFASPIGLQMILENPDKKKRQTDFLASIEIMVIDQAHVIEMQNWDHVLTVLKYLNKIPEQLHDTDFSRVRMWSIEDQAKYFTQSLVFTEYNTPNINNLLTRSKNIFGKYRFRSVIEAKDCGLSKVGLKVKQVFTRFESSSPFNEPDERFNHFKSVIIPAFSKSTTYEDGLLLYIPSYTDFIRIKNYMHDKTSLDFCDVNEYSTQKQLTKYRALFQQGRRKILLYTERLHHYRRFELRGVKNIFMYGVPTNPLFYAEIVSCLGRSAYDEISDLDISSARVLYSKWDALALERVVGSDRAPVLTHGQNEFYEFR